MTRRSGRTPCSSNSLTFIDAIYPTNNYIRSPSRTYLRCSLIHSISDWCPVSGAQCGTCAWPNHWQHMFHTKNAPDSHPEEQKNGHLWDKYWSTFQHREGRLQYKSQQCQKQTLITKMKVSQKHNNNKTNAISNLLMTTHLNMYEARGSSCAEMSRNSLERHHSGKPKQRLKVCTNTAQHGYKEVITDLHIKPPGISHWDLLEVEVDGSAENCILPLRAYKRVFAYNLTKDFLPKPNTLQSASHVILKSYTDGILPIHGTFIIKVAQYWTRKLMPIRFFIVDIRNEVIISHEASTQWGIINTLCHNRTAKHLHLDTIRNTLLNFRTHPQHQPFTPYPRTYNCASFSRPYSNHSPITRPSHNHFPITKP